MKGLIVILAVLLPWLCVAQQYGESLRLEVTSNKTTNLVFAASIVSIDRGSEQVMVQKAATNILRVKSASETLTETNLTVVTSDGKLFSFLVVYSDTPKHLTIYLNEQNTVSVESKFTPSCNKVFTEKNNVAALQYSSGKVTLKCLGFYIKEKEIYCKLTMLNKSLIGYDIDQFRLYIRDNSISKRTASQEIGQQPLHVAGDMGTIKGASARSWVVVLPKFTIPDDKHLEIEILEKNGGRHMLIKAYNRQVLLAKEF